MEIHPREHWQSSSQPVSSGNKYIVGNVHTAVCHWPGAASNWKPPTSDDGVANYLRSTQNDYVTNRGYSLGYNFHISQTPYPGNVWEIRGFDFRNAANNGDKGQYANINWNDFTVSMQFAASESWPMTADQQLASRYLLQHFDDHHNETLDLKGHRDSDGTTCPGDYIYGRLDEIAVRPEGEEDMPLTDQDVQKVARAVWEYMIGDPDQNENNPAGWRLKQIQGMCRTYLGGFQDSAELPDRTLLQEIHKNTKT